MRDQELIGLYEAYQQVHTQQRLINEEVEIASHYFCEMGLNEIGVQILIEELGVEEFAEFVYDISEDYYLTEARAAKKRTGGKSYAEVKAEIDNKEAVKKKAKDEKQSAAVAAAANQQPQRKGILRRVGDAIVAGIDRHNYAMKASEKTASKIGKAAREFGTGLMSSYDNWVGQLISDGYDLSNWTDEGLFEYYEQLCEESLERGQSPTPGGKKPATSAIPPKPPKGTPVNTGYKESYDEPNVLGRLDTLARDTAGRVGGEIGARKGRERLGNILGIPEKIGRERGTERGQAVYDKAKETVGGLLKQSYEYDLYDTILEYLITEGYADTNENALVIMANMSEEWRQSIVEETLDERNRGEEGMSDREVSRRRNLGGNTRSEVSSSSLGDHGPQGAIQKFHNVKSKQRKEIHKTSRGLRGDTGESGGKGRYEANKDHKDGYPSITKRGQGPS